MHRRSFLTALAGFAAIGSHTAKAASLAQDTQPFSKVTLIEEARALARNPYVAPDMVPQEWRDLLRTYIAENNFDFTFVVDDNALGANNHNIGFIPTMLIIDRNDIIRRKYETSAATDVEKMLTDIRRILKEEADGTAPTEPLPVVVDEHDHDHGGM